MWSLTQFKDWALAQGSVAKYNDGQYKGECVSLINQYCYRVLAIPAEAWGHAKDWATNPAPLTHFDKVGSVQAGDVLVYGATSGNPYGHIEIALGGGQALGQNRNLDGKVRVATMLTNYSAILRSKNGGGDNMGTEQDARDLAFQIGLEGHASLEELTPSWVNDNGGRIYKGGFKYAAAMSKQITEGATWQEANWWLVHHEEELKKAYEKGKAEAGGGEYIKVSDLYIKK